MSDLHNESIKDLAAAYAIGALDEHEVREFEALLAQSKELQREVAEYREVSGQMVHGAPAVEPDPSLRQRLLDQIKIDSVTKATPIRRRGTNWMLGLGWAAAAAGIVLAAVQTLRVGDLSNRLAAREQEVGELAAALDGRQATLDEILEPSTVLFLLTSTTAQPPGIQLFWNRTENRVVLHAFALDPAPTGREYQLWFLSDGAAVPASTFNADPDGHRLVTLPGPPEGMEIQGAAVTVEPIGGSAQPTTPIILLGNVVLD